MSKRRRIVLAATSIGGILLLGVGGLASGYFAGASNGNGGFTDHYVSATPKVTAPAATPPTTTSVGAHEKCRALLASCAEAEARG